jgi:transcriptional regulator with XRE-family HTH domain
MTQEQLATRLAIRKGAVSAWERGYTQPTAGRRRALEEIFGSALTGRGSAVAESPGIYPSAGQRVSADLTPDEAKVLRIYRWLVQQSRGVPGFGGDGS